MVHLLAHNVILNPLHLLQEPCLLLKCSLNEKVVLTELLAELEDDSALLLARLLHQSG